MKITTDKDLNPNLQKYLPQIDDSFLFHKNYNIKHPSPLYNISISKLDESLETFLKILLKYNAQDFDKVSKEDERKILKTYKEFLYSCREHLDDCFSIIKIFIKPPKKERVRRDQCLWLKLNAKTETLQFFNNITEYKKYLDNSVNELKHNNGVMGGLGFYSSNTPGKCLGYFIANVVNEEYIPVEKIHSKFKNMYTGFSFRRDLNYNLFNIYQLSEEIILFLKENCGLDLASIKTDVKSAPEKKEGIFKKIMEIPKIHFPDEYTKPIPSTVLGEEGLQLEYPSKLSIKPNNLDKGVLIYPGDGYTKKFKMLYLK